MATTFIENYIISKIFPTTSNETPLTLLSTAQMFGSGKTWLGNHFLSELRSMKNEKFRNKLCELQTYSENFQTKIKSITLFQFNLFEALSEASNMLLNCTYVCIDLREFCQSLHSTDIEATIKTMIKTSLVTCLLLCVPEEKRQEPINFWRNEPIVSTQITEIIDYFSVLLGTKLFVHFDELDSIFLPTDSNDIQLNKLYLFWNQIHVILTRQHFLYCSGRTSLLLAIGKTGKSSNRSPGKNICLLLDTLKVDHLKELFKPFFQSKTDTMHLGDTQEETKAKMVAKVENDDFMKEEEEKKDKNEEEYEEEKKDEYECEECEECEHEDEYEEKNDNDPMQVEEKEKEQKEVKTKKIPDFQSFIEYIYRLTGGVPRLVYFVLEFLHSKDPNPWDDFVDFKKFEEEFDKHLL